MPGVEEAVESAAAAAVVVAVVAVVVEEEGEEEAAHADDLSRDWNRRCELRFNYRFSMPITHGMADLMHV